MSSKGTANPNPTPKKPSKSSLPAPDVQEFRAELSRALQAKDEQGRRIASSKWGVYAFYDYDDEPIYVGQTKESLSQRVGRHLTNQRTDAVAMRILDVFEVARLRMWPLWDLVRVEEQEGKQAAKKQLDASEYSAYLEAILASKFQAILNEKIPPLSSPVELPQSYDFPLVSDEVRGERGHPDVRIARRAETIARLSAVARERGQVSEGLRRVLVIQAVRLAYISAVRLAHAEGRPSPSPEAISVEGLVGSVLFERGDDSSDEEGGD